MDKTKNIQRSVRLKRITRQQAKLLYYQGKVIVCKYKNNRVNIKKNFHYTENWTFEDDVISSKIDIQMYWWRVRFEYYILISNKKGL